MQGRLHRLTISQREPTMPDDRDHLHRLIAEFIEAEDASNREMELHEEHGRAWSSAPVVRRLHAVEALRRAINEST
ncbi:MAG: hypothetical protein K0S94_2901 [Nitrospira sp.]|nr:hypothetical protein [Nitrospira sp.]